MAHDICTTFWQLSIYCLLSFNSSFSCVFNCYLNLAYCFLIGIFISSCYNCMKSLLKEEISLAICSALYFAHRRSLVNVYWFNMITANYRSILLKSSFSLISRHRQGHTKKQFLKLFYQDINKHCGTDCLLPLLVTELCNL